MQYCHSPAKTNLCNWTNLLIVQLPHPGNAVQEWQNSCLETLACSFPSTFLPSVLEIQASCRLCESTNQQRKQKAVEAFKFHFNLKIKKHKFCSVIHWQIKHPVPWTWTCALLWVKGFGCVWDSSVSLAKSMFNLQTSKIHFMSFHFNPHSGLVA